MDAVESERIRMQEAGDIEADIRPGIKSKSQKNLPDLIGFKKKKLLIVI